MKTLLKNLGILLVLAGVVCLAIYFFAKPTNALLVSSLALELVGIITYAVVNRFVD